MSEIGARRLDYVIGNKIGSHHVHGTWVSLRTHYLRKFNNGEYGPRDHDCPTHVNQYVYIPLVVLSAIVSFVYFICAKDSDAEGLIKLLAGVEQEIRKINAELVGKDFDFVEEA